MYYLTDTQIIIMSNKLRNTDNINITIWDYKNDRKVKSCIITYNGSIFNFELYILKDLRIVYYNESEIFILNPQTLKVEISFLNSQRINLLRILPDEQIILADDKELSIWDTNNGTCLIRYQTRDKINELYINNNLLIAVSNNFIEIRI